jgi:hypothetical protein
MTPTDPQRREAVEALDAAIKRWPEDAEWKPVQMLCAIGDRMVFPVEAVLNGKSIDSGKDYILRDVVESVLTPPPVESVGDENEWALSIPGKFRVDSHGGYAVFDARSGKYKAGKFNLMETSTPQDILDVLSAPPLVPADAARKAVEILKRARHKLNDGSGTAYSGAPMAYIDQALTLLQQAAQSTSTHKTPCGANLEVKETPEGRKYYLDGTLIWQPAKVHRVALQMAILEEDKRKYNAPDKGKGGGGKDV